MITMLPITPARQSVRQHVASHGATVQRLPSPDWIRRQVRHALRRLLPRFAGLGLLVMAVHCAAVVPALMDLTFTCDPRPANEQTRAYRFYERAGTNWLFLGSVPTNRFVVTNVNVLVPHTYGVTSSNILGESDYSIPYTAPSDPRPPANVQIISSSLRLSTNGSFSIEGTTDLAQWSEKLRLNGNRLTFITQPMDPKVFWRERLVPAPPLP